MNSHNHGTRYHQPEQIDSLQTSDASVAIDQVDELEQDRHCAMYDREDGQVTGEQVNLETVELSQEEEEEEQLVRQEDEVGDYDLTCEGYVRRKLAKFMTVLAWGLVSACCWACSFWCMGQLRDRAHSHQLLFAASAPLLLAAGTGLLARHFQLGNLASTVRYHWRPILCSAALLCISLQLAFRAAQRLPVAADAACIWSSYAGIMSLPLCFVLQISCTQYGIIAAILTILNLGLLTRPTFLRVAVAEIVGAGGNVTNVSRYGDSALLLPPSTQPTPPIDFAGCVAAAVFLAVSVTLIYWKLSGVSVLPMLTLTCALMCVASVCLQLLTVDRPLKPPRLRPADAPLAVGAVFSVAAGLPLLLHWLRSERSRWFQLATGTCVSIAHLVGFLTSGQRPDPISLTAAALVQVATALVTLGQMRHESWLQYREDSKYKYSRLTILPDTPFQSPNGPVSSGPNGTVTTMAETSFNSVTVRRQSDSGHHNGDAFFQEVSLADDDSGGFEGAGNSGGSSGFGGFDEGAWKPLNLR